MADPRQSNSISTWTLLTAIGLLVSGALAEIMPVDPSKNITWPYHAFKTVDFRPPWLNITQRVTPSDDYLFLSPDGATETQLGPVIMDMNGELIWNGPVEDGSNFGVYQYYGERVLGWWNGSVFASPLGRGYGAIHLYNDRYHPLKTVTLPGNFLTVVPNKFYRSNVDIHELYITDRGSVLVTANNVTQADLTSVGGPKDGWVVAGLVYEIDIASNEVLFKWNSVDHLDELPFTSSHYPLGSEGLTGTDQSVAWGYFHINSVEPYEGGYLISSRYMCSAIALDGVDGHVKWRLDGRTGGDFKLVGPNDITGFCYQHDIRVVEARPSGVTLGLHDNHNCPIDNGTVPSTAKTVHIDFDTKEVNLVTRFLNHSDPVYAIAQGSRQPLANGHIFVGHGWIPVAEEYSPSGSILTTIQYGAADPKPGGGFLSAPKPTFSYRTYRQSWVGCPETGPDVVAMAAEGYVRVFVSWNGATEVEAWEVYGGDSTKHMKRMATKMKSEFETEIEVGKVKYVQVRPVMRRKCRCTSRRSSYISVV